VLFRSRRAMDEMALVPVGHTLVKPRRLFFRLSEDLSPFMYEVPRCYGTHEVFLKQLGVRESPSRADYQYFLQELQSEAGEQPLNPNELRAVLAIVQSLATSTLEGEDDVGLRTTRSSSQRDFIYVPDYFSVLRPATNCLVCDDDWLRDQVQTAVRSLGLHWLHPTLSMDMRADTDTQTMTSTATALGIPKLSEMVSESLVDVQSEACVENETDDSLSIDTSRLQTALQDPVFVAAVQALIGKLSSSQSARPDASSVLQAVTVQPVASLMVALRVRDPRSASEADAGYEAGDTHGENRPALSFVQDRCILVNRSLLQPPLNAPLAVGRGLSSLLRLPQHISPTLALLLQSSALASVRLLDSLRVGGVTERGTADWQFQVTKRSVPGAPLTEEDCDLLELKPFRSFRQGEVVAVSKYLCVEAVGSSDKVATPLPESMVYAVVVHSAEEPDSTTGLGLRRVMLRVSSGGLPVSLLSSDVYAFRAAKSKGVAKTVIKDTSPRVLSSSRPGSSPVMPAVSAPSLSSSTVPTAVDAAAEANPALVSLTTVRRTEALQALHALLERAGIPPDLDAQSMCGRITELTEAVSYLESQLNTERQQIAQLREHQQQAAAALVCEICVSQPRTHVLSPCGHTCCANCVTQLPRNKCPFCRSNIQQNVRFFLPGMSAT